MIGLKVVMGDPGRKGDPFGIVGTSFNLDDYKIKFKLAKQFKNRPYSEVARYLQDIKNKIRPNFMGIETNNKGGRLLKLYHEKYKMTWLHGINTAGDMTEKSRSKGYSMDKPFMVKWFAKKKDEGMFVFPDIPTVDMQELIDQIPQIVSIRTAGGQISYKAQRGRHDDLFVAALHCCNFIRLFIEQQERLK